MGAKNEMLHPPENPLCGHKLNSVCTGNSCEQLNFSIIIQQQMLGEKVRCAKIGMLFPSFRPQNLTSFPSQNSLKVENCGTF